MEIQLNTELPRRVLKATWSVESLDEVFNVYGVSVRDKPLCSKYKGPKRTVKQRNKFMTSFFIGKTNKRILANRKKIKDEKAVINSMAEEIRKEIDKEILNNILIMSKNGLSI